jgi:hypothetical protein
MPESFTAAMLPHVWLSQKTALRLLRDLLDRNQFFPGVSWKDIQGQFDSEFQKPRDLPRHQGPPPAGLLAMTDSNEDCAQLSAYLAWLHKTLAQLDAERT